MFSEQKRGEVPPIAFDRTQERGCGLCCRSDVCFDHLRSGLWCQWRSKTAVVTAVVSRDSCMRWHARTPAAGGAKSRIHNVAAQKRLMDVAEYQGHSWATWRG